MTGAGADQAASFALLAAVAAMAFLVVSRRPTVGLALFLIVVAFVPYWLGPTALTIYVPPACAVGAFALAAWQGRSPSPITLADAGVLALFAACLVPFAVGAGSRATIFVVLLHWAVGYGVGRFAPSRVGLDRLHRIVAIVFTVVAIGLLVEFAAHGNPFVEISRPGALYRGWGTLQERGGITRAEGAFGHSIAAGACLAMALPLTIAAGFRTSVRAVMCTLMLAGTVVTFSRIGIICAMLGVVLSVCLLPGIPRNIRVGTLATFVVVALASFSRIASVFDDAGTEASGSAGYRLDLTALLPYLSPLGLSTSAHRDAAGTLRFGTFRSIDSALLLAGLTYGLIALVVAVLLLGAVWVTVLRREAAPATIALAAQLPALLTVALITQYAVFLWFIAGLAAASQSLTRAAQHEPPGALTAPPLSAASAGRST